MSSFGRNGETMLVSYRDPKLGETNRVYEGIPEYLRTFSIDDRDMTKYVIGAFSELDAPLNPAAKGARNLGAWLSGVTDEMIQRERDQVLNGDPGGYPGTGRTVRVCVKHRRSLCHWK